MTEQTALLNLPYIMPAQAQKHVTHNEALKILDALMHIRVEDTDRDEPPAAPIEGERWIVGNSPVDAFAGQAGMIAAFQDGAWSFHQPREGWVVWNAADDRLQVFDGTVWGSVSDLRDIPFIGVNATADMTNRLAVAGDATLLSHDGNGHQLKINKATVGDTASLLFQSGWSGRAEMGLAGNDDFSIKVSPDGTTWHAALTADHDTGGLSARKLEIASGVAGESGLSFGDVTSTSATTSHNNKALGLDAEGKVVQRAASFPAYVMTGIAADTTIARDYNGQVAKGTGIYLGDNGGAIANGPASDWYSMTVTGRNGNFFCQLTVTNKNAYFRGGAAGSPGSATWYTLSKQASLTGGFVPYYLVAGVESGFVDSLLYQGNGVVAVGTTAPHASALFDLSSTGRGFLPPRMTSVQRDAIASPAEGLMIYNLTDHEPQVWNGSAWMGMTS